MGWEAVTGWYIMVTIGDAPWLSLGIYLKDSISAVEFIHSVPHQAVLPRFQQRSCNTRDAPLLRCACEARLLVFTITKKTLFHFSVLGNFPFCSQGSSQLLLYIGKNNWIMLSDSYIFKNKKLLFLAVKEAQTQSLCTYLGKWENAFLLSWGDKNFLDHSTRTLFGSVCYIIFEYLSCHPLLP